MKKIAISVGDINGIGIEIALRSHVEITRICKPIYCINKTMLNRASALLKIDIPKDFTCKECGEIFSIEAGKSTKEAGLLSYKSFCTAVKLAKQKKVKAIVTLPINKQSWRKADTPHMGHTDALSSQAIMMLGCENMFIILYTHHIPLKHVSKIITSKKLKKFLLKVYNSLLIENIGVLGFNPHASDGGVIGKEDFKIVDAIKKVNKKLGREVFKGPLVPDTAFTRKNREIFKYFVCMYHDQGLIPLKALYFDESINVSLNAGIIRTSVDHGTAYSIAYKNKNPSTTSFINAIKKATSLCLN